MGTLSSAMSLLPLFSLVTVALAAPPLVDFDNLILSRNASGSEPVYDGFDLSGSGIGSAEDFDSRSGSGSESEVDYDGFDGSEAEDFANLTMSRAAEERAINTCNCAPVSSSDRIVGGKEVNPKYKLPYQVLVSAQPCTSQGCLMCGGTILNKRYV